MEDERLLADIERIVNKLVNVRAELNNIGAEIRGLTRKKAIEKEIIEDPDPDDESAEPKETQSEKCKNYLEVRLGPKNFRDLLKRIENDELVRKFVRPMKRKLEFIPYDA